MIVMTVDAKCRRFLEAGMVKFTSGSQETVVILSKRRCSTILLVAWKTTTQAPCTDISSRWRAKWRLQSVATHSEVWTLHRSSLATPPQVYSCDSDKWTQIFLPALLATKPRRLGPHFCNEAINEIARAVSSRRSRGETGGYIPLGNDIS